MALKLCLRSGEKFQQLKHLLLFQRFRVWLLATTWKFTMICNPNSRRSSTLSDFHCTRHTCIVLLASLQLHYLYHSLSLFLSYTNTEKHWVIIITFRLRKMFMKSITSSSKKWQSRDSFCINTCSWNMQESQGTVVSIHEIL